jgi:hypothetical protein
MFSVPRRITAACAGTKARLFIYRSLLSSRLIWTTPIGKHHIVFNTVETTSLDSLPTANKKPENEQITLPKANLQIMAGKHIGHIVPLGGLYRVSLFISPEKLHGNMVDKNNIIMF